MIEASGRRAIDLLSLPLAPLGEAVRLPIMEAVRRRIVVLDAGMGQRLVLRGLDLKNDDPALWCLSHPEEVAAIHGRDLSAGAGAVLTNTFGANRAWLARFGQVREVESVNRRAVELARGAPGPERFVVGSMGPTVGSAEGAAAEQAAILIAAGVDALLLETCHFPEVEPVLEEVIAHAEPGAVPVFVSLWEWPAEPEPAARRLVERGAAVLGLNCRCGAAAALEFARALGEAGGVPLMVKPGAQSEAGHAMSPEDLGAIVPLLLAQNVRLIGGCCGTDERHVAAIADCAGIHGVSFRYPRGDTS